MLIFSTLICLLWRHSDLLHHDWSIRRCCYCCTLIGLFLLTVEPFEDINLCNRSYSFEEYFSYLVHLSLGLSLSNLSNVESSFAVIYFTFLLVSKEELLFFVVSFSTGSSGICTHRCFSMCCSLFFSTRAHVRPFLHPHIRKPPPNRYVGEHCSPSILTGKHQPILLWWRLAQHWSAPQFICSWHCVKIPRAQTSRSVTTM